MDAEPKPLDFVGSARRELRAFPKAARDVAGEDLYRVQKGREPRDWKSLPEVGPGTYEIRVRTAQGGSVQFRVIYVAKFREAVYVLHAFEKKTQQIPPHHLELAQSRYRQLLRERENRKP